jgi:hypothetical protein
MVVARRPPRSMASIGTPAGSSHSGAIAGSCAAGVVKRALGCAAFSSESGVQSLPFQSMACAGGSLVMPSHQMSPSSVFAQLVKIEFAAMVAIALRLVMTLVLGATPKKPASGLIA